MKKSPILIFILLIVIVILANLVYFSSYKPLEKNETSINPESSNQKIKPSQFTSKITNPYFTLKSGTKFLYRAQRKEGTETSEVYVTNETKLILGVKTQVVWDRVWLDNELIEDTRDFYAQDKEGNVWYFGEDSHEISQGQVKSTDGSWEAGVNGAEPGIIMQASPDIGGNYKQEFYKGQAEDSAKVLSISEKVTVPYGSFADCIKTLDYTPLEPGIEENKYYCSKIGGLVLEVDLETRVKNQLIGIEYDSEPTPALSAELRQLGAKFSEAQAKEIALSRVPGNVTDLSLEKKFGRFCYVVEIITDSGTQTDIFIDIESGRVLGIEP